MERNTERNRGRGWGERDRRIAIMTKNKQTNKQTNKHSQRIFSYKLTSKGFHTKRFTENV